MRQSAVARCLAGGSETDQHYSKAYIEGLEKLKYFCLEPWHIALQVQVRQRTLNLLLEFCVLGCWHLDVREEVLDECLKEWQVVLEKLGYVGVSHRAYKNNFLRHVLKGAFEVSSHVENALDGAHAKIVVVLLRQLLGREFVELHHLL